MLVGAGYGDESRRYCGREDVARVQGCGLAGVAGDFYGVSGEAKGLDSLRHVAILLIEGCVFVVGVRWVVLRVIRDFKRLLRGCFGSLAKQSRALLRRCAGFCDQSALDPDEGACVVRRLPVEQDSFGVDVSCKGRSWCGRWSGG